VKEIVYSDLDFNFSIYNIRIITNDLLIIYYLTPFQTLADHLAQKLVGNEVLAFKKRRGE